MSVSSPRPSLLIPRWGADLVALALLAAMAVFLTWRADLIGLTIDEPFHFMRGVAWWWTDTTKLSYAHPPLGNLLQAMPSLGVPPPVDLTTEPGWDVSNHARMVKHLLLTQYDYVREVILTGRLVTSGLTVGLAAVAYGWVSRRFGSLEGLLTLAFLVGNPTLLAHGQLFTTDLPVTLGVLLVGIGFAEYLMPPARTVGRWWSLAAFSLAVAIALGTKFTSLALVPLLGGIGAWAAWQGWGRFEGTPRGHAVRSLAGEVAVVALTSMLVVAALYRFEDVGLTVEEILNRPEPQCHVTIPLKHEMLEGRTIGALPGWLPLPVPYTWLFGVEMVRHHAAQGHSTWFAGFLYSWGNPAYFPSLFLLKTPWLVLVGLGAALTGWIRDRRWPRMEHAVLLAISGFLLGLLMISNLNIGFRHALPIVPPLTIVAATGFRELLDALRTRFGERAVLGALGLVILQVVLVAPRAGRYLSWFNVGPIGHSINMVGEDWGQDTIRLARAVEADALTPLIYNPYGTQALAEAKHQGLEFTKTKCGRPLDADEGWLAVHASVHVRYPDCHPGITDRAPDRVIADHIRMWRLGRHRRR